MLFVHSTLKYTAGNYKANGVFVDVPHLLNVTINGLKGCHSLINKNVIVVSCYTMRERMLQEMLLSENIQL